MRLLLCLLLTACAATSGPRGPAPRAGHGIFSDWIADLEANHPARPPAAPRDPAALQCPPGTQMVELASTPQAPRISSSDRITSCCMGGGCEPQRDPVWYATVCQQPVQVPGLVVRAVACRGVDGAVDGPFVVLTDQARIDGACRRDVLDGRWSWRVDLRSALVRVREEGAFVDGARAGPWTIASDDGTTISRGHFVDGARVGVWTTELLARGAIVEHRTERHGDDGLLVSESRAPDGALRQRTVLRHGLPDGVQERWTDGVRSTTTYERGRVVAQDEWYAGAHTLCTTPVVGDERCQYWDAQGALRIEGTRAAGASHARWTAWYPTGERLGTTSSRGSIQGGMWATSDGQQRLWYRDGTPLSHMTCVAGEARGRARVWYPDGTLHFDDIRRSPNQQSKYQAFAPDGTPSEAASHCGDPAMSCQLRGSSHQCMALWEFTIAAPPYAER